MSAPSTKLTVSMTEDVVLIRVAGRAICTAGCDFKKLANELGQRGYHSFLIDLKDCELMDSTFLGLLADLAMRAEEASGDSGGSPSIKLFNPNQRVLEIIEQLGIAELFDIIRSEEAPEIDGETITASPARYTRAEVSQTCLEAHRRLMDLNPENVARFKDVTKFLAEDLQRLEVKK
ncbi:MAG TPA: STAS domain-containing protein [Verrucomicrobiae bacterium]|nr:STAS domain-containing protein [Verrucomicrobiae bacterium]